MVYIVCKFLITISVILLIWAVIYTIDNWIRWIGEKLEKRGFYDD